VNTALGEDQPRSEHLFAEWEEFQRRYNQPRRSANLPANKVIDGKVAALGNSGI
jgi:hypothetical protein